MTAPARTTIDNLPAIQDAQVSGGSLAMDGADGNTARVTPAQLVVTVPDIDPAELSVASTVVAVGTDGVPGATTLTQLAAILPSGGTKYRVPFVYGTDDDTGPGSYTHTVSAGVSRVEIEVWGGGGGTDLNLPASAGGGAGYVWAAKAVSPGDMLAIVVGAGAGAAHPSVSGADSTVDGTGIVAGGGFPGGLSGSEVDGGAGGLPTWDSGYVVAARGLVGQPGQNINHVTSAGLSPSTLSRGGNAPLGGAGALTMYDIGSSQDTDTGSGTKLSSGGQPAMQPGGGGAQSENDQFNGGDGLVIVWEYQ